MRGRVEDGAGETAGDKSEKKPAVPKTGAIMPKKSNKAAKS
jgi:hypothetical protein